MGWICCESREGIDLSYLNRCNILLTTSITSKPYSLMMLTCISDYTAKQEKSQTVFWSNAFKHHDGTSLL